MEWIDRAHAAAVGRRRETSQSARDGTHTKMATYSTILCDSEWVTVAIYTARFE